MLLRSQVDSSINWIEKNYKGYYETRFVQRAEDYIICYLSSQTGCNQGCEFCHLTNTNQREFEDADWPDFMRQAIKVIDHYKATAKKPNGYVKLESKVKRLNYNFMARGEPLINPTLGHPELYNVLIRLAKEIDLEPVLNISTIMPKKFKGYLHAFFPENVSPTIYYSIYSVNPDFRKKWIPAAQNPLVALENLREYRQKRDANIILHSSFIEGENDSPQDVQDMIDHILYSDLQTPFNIVRYNPYSPVQGNESPSLDRIKTQLEDAGIPTRILNRVGPDIACSCGQFIEPSNQ